MLYKMAQWPTRWLNPLGDAQWPTRWLNALQDGPMAYEMAQWPTRWLNPLGDGSMAYEMSTPPTLSSGAWQFIFTFINDTSNV